MLFHGKVVSLKIQSFLVTSCSILILASGIGIPKIIFTPTCPVFVVFVVVDGNVIFLIFGLFQSELLHLRVRALFWYNLFWIPIVTALRTSICSLIGIKAAHILSIITYEYKNFDKDNIRIYTNKTTTTITIMF